MIYFRFLYILVIQKTALNPKTNNSKNNKPQSKISIFMHISTFSEYAPWFPNYVSTCSIIKMWREKFPANTVHRTSAVSKSCKYKYKQCYKHTADIWTVENIYKSFMQYYSDNAGVLTHDWNNLLGHVFLSDQFAHTGPTPSKSVRVIWWNPSSDVLFQCNRQFGQQPRPQSVVRWHGTS